MPDRVAPVIPDAVVAQTFDEGFLVGYDKSRRPEEAGHYRQTLAKHYEENQATAVAKMGECRASMKEPSPRRCACAFMDPQTPLEWEAAPRDGESSMLGVIPSVRTAV